MARARSIKPGFYKNEDMAECSVWARLLFPGLWMLADREGRLEDRARRIKGELFPFDSVEVDPLLSELERWKFIIRYEKNGIRYIQILNFAKHQKPHPREKASEIPEPDGYQPPDSDNKGDDEAQPRHNLGSDEAQPRQCQAGPSSLNPSSLNPSSLNPDLERGSKILTEGSAKTEKPDADASRPPPENQSISFEKSTQTPIPQPFRPTEAAVRLAEKHELDVGTEADLFVAHYESTGDFRADWDACFRKWLLRSMQHKADSEKRAQGPPSLRKNVNKSKTFSAFDYSRGGDGYGNKREEGRIFEGQLAAGQLGFQGESSD